MKSHQKSRQGFTLIELMIATLVFSVVLLVILSAFVQISRLFYKGVNLSRTHEDSRQIVQDIADDINFAQAAPDPSSFDAKANTSPGSYKVGVFCIGLHAYRYQMGYQLGSGSANNYALQRWTVAPGAGCKSSSGNSLPANSNDPVELLDNDMQLNDLSVNCTGGLCRISIHVVFYGGDPQGLLTTSNSAYSSNPWLAPDAECTGSLVDSQYCATADYASAVLQSQ